MHISDQHHWLRFMWTGIAAIFIGSRLGESRNSRAAVFSRQDAGGFAVNRMAYDLKIFV
ncbi:MAG: hypothetical protein ABI270_08520 [Nitrosospira sp.]